VCCRIPAAWSRGPAIHIFDAGTPAPLTQWRGHGNAARGLAYSPDGQTLASGDLDGSVQVWSAPPPAE
jgi:WD40 repeat protein